VKDRVFHSGGNGSPDSGPVSWFALRTDDPRALADHLRHLQPTDVKRHFANGDFERWLTELYKRPDLAEAVRRLRATWNGEQNPRAELVAVLESSHYKAS
jgi:hypothetical protein